MTNSPQSQDELILEEILNEFDGEINVGVAWPQAIEKLLAWRRTTSLEALPETAQIDLLDTPTQEYIDFYIQGWNACLDLTKKNIGDLK